MKTTLTPVTVARARETAASAGAQHEPPADARASAPSFTTLVLLAWLVLGLPVVAVGQSVREVNEANNPLTPKLTINLQDIYTPSYFGLPDSDANTGLLRGVLL
jgi:hypothetical protein